MRALLGILMLSISATAAAKGVAVSAPELDPATAMAALTLLTGGLAMIRGRRTKR